MIWTVWGVMLVTHGAFARWAETSRRFALAMILADVLLIAIGLMTIEQLQGLGTQDFVRVGLFFIVFGTAGRQLMHHLLQRFAPQQPSRPAG